MLPDRSNDVPSPIDLRKMSDAKAWVEDTIARRPWRHLFFTAITDALNNHFTSPFSIVELGSGPGHLAKAILKNCPVREYLAVDFSEAMHTLAKEYLEDVGHQVNFLTADFREAWRSGYNRVDVVVTMQAAHEVRHKRHQPSFFAKVRDALQPSGIFLYCDHYWETGSNKHPDLYFEKAEQVQALSDAGFSRISLLLDHGGMALFACNS